MRIFAAVLLLFLLAGCAAGTRPAAAPAAAGRAVYQAERTAPDGTRTLVSINYTAPENDLKGSSFSFGEVDPAAWADSYRPVIAATFGGQHKPAEQPKPDSAGHDMGQYILYGCGAICLLVGLGLVGVGRHVKLGTLAFVGSGVFFTIAVTIERFAWIYAYALGGGVVIVLSAVGWALWRDYRDGQMPTTIPSIA
jgi:hypothetical protein